MISVSIPKLRAWAEAKPAGEVIGTAANVCECPIAHYIEDHGGLSPHVDNGRPASYYDEKRGDRFKIREYGNIGLIIHLTDGLGYFQPVTREDFLEVLTTAQNWSKR